MADRTSIVISDVHLGEVSPDTERAFVSFLESLTGTAHELLDGPVEIAIASRRAYVAHARALLARRPELDLVIFGHAHRPELLEVQPGRYHLNAGDWIHHRSFGVLSDDAIELRHWS